MTTDSQAPAKTNTKTFGDYARFVRDWIGFPAAVITAITALYVPAKNNVLAALGRDAPSLSLDYLYIDSLNLGLDDAAIAQQANEVFVTVPVYHYTLTNAGPTAATVRPQLTCSTDTLTGHFNLIDTTTTRRQLNDFKLSANESAFVNIVLAESGTPEQGYRPTAKPFTCEMAYADKYGFQKLVIPFDDGQPKKTKSEKNLSINPLSFGGVDDRRIGLRELYCPDMVRGLDLGTGPIDCLSDKQLLAIDPVYLWEGALQRVLRQANDFRQATAGTAPRTPGLILTKCEGPDCATKTDEMLRTLHSSTPALTVWMCPEKPPGQDQTPPAKVVLHDVCEEHSFPVTP
ncbi:hypothetical protein ACWGS9_32010 [Bradyrhizobium sp. Arg314]